MVLCARRTSELIDSVSLNTVLSNDAARLPCDLVVEKNVVVL